MNTAHEIPPDASPIPGNAGMDGAQGVSRRGRKKSGLPNRTNGNKRVFIRVLPGEHAAMAERAAEAGLTVSEFIRRIALGHKTQSRFDYDVLEHLIRLHTDMNRLGNLFKMSLKQDGGGNGGSLSYLDRERQRSVLQAIEDNQELLKNYIGGFSI